MKRRDATRHLPRIGSGALAAVLVLGACGADDEGADQAPLPTPADTSDDGPVATPVTSAPRPTVPVSPPTSLPPDDQLSEAIATVIEDSSGPRVCFDVLESLPPQCGTGLGLVDWSWEAITVEITQGDTTWVDQIYVNGTYDAAAQTFTVDEARPPTDDDRQRILLSAQLPDFSVPCPAPEGGWPARTHEWPGAEVAAIDGYAGSWVSDPGVVTVKFTGDLDAAEAAVREHYSDALCVVGASHAEAELLEIQERLLSMSSVELLSTGIYVDASGEWIEAVTVAPDPARQAAFDEEFGADVVRLTSRLQPVPTATASETTSAP